MDNNDRIQQELVNNRIKLLVKNGFTPNGNGAYFRSGENPCVIHNAEIKNHTREEWLEWRTENQVYL